MKLSLIERILIQDILPARGAFEEIIIRQDILQKTKITQDEISKYEIKSAENGAITWNQQGVESEEEYALTEAETNELKKALVKLSEDKALTAQHVSLYKKFVGQ